MEALDRFKKIHIWIGTTDVDEDIYYDYFDQDNYDVSQFAKDIGIDEYDEDFICILPPFEDIMNIELILKESPIYDSNFEEVLQVCRNMGIETANSIVYFTDASIILEKPYKTDYNGLKYIGLFDC